MDPCGADITNPDKAGNLFTRFFQWWHGGRAGDTGRCKGRKVRDALSWQVKLGQPQHCNADYQQFRLLFHCCHSRCALLCCCCCMFPAWLWLQPKGDVPGVSSCKQMHSALQDHVSRCCSEAGLPCFTLALLPGYEMVFKAYCTKGGKGTAAGGGRRFIAPNMAFTREALFKMCLKLLRCNKSISARNLSIILYQIATVSRGDDVRPRKLLELALRHMAAIGKRDMPTIKRETPTHQHINSRAFRLGIHSDSSYSSLHTATAHCSAACRAFTVLGHQCRARC